MTISQGREVERSILLTAEVRDEGPVRQQNEAKLIEKARSDPAAFGQLYEKYYSLIHNYIYRRTLNIATAEDLTSNTFFKALRALPRYKHRAPFCAWLYRIASNEIRMHRRSAWFRRRVCVDHAAQDQMDRIYFVSPEVHTRIEKEERMKQYAALHQAMGKLPERYQAVLVLRYYEGLKYEEIAHVLGKRPGTVKSLVSRGLKRIGKLMEKKNATIP